ncbi:hypothetical protein L486_07724 [Kwoniella mangroviensis CBS 10435]|uniref:A-kinase anchor protein 7-like phosphoesterase domain-containing protein n=1 Tax=Kwoniella mangroviensis CBS 10435 TaxID=1331196 RepID=A0A1B9IGF8_9TREE|nr:uncharacterized protein I203_07024 [Kwoniella mangroviensis CBS 8507]OCF54592.1 hypothetical protein L486_07724 [Kwoniella mangroviensis CBS 10435]OCF63705.1 hypothetical protein I203_07024 [Kwoniella mangroviensis CBS 8507]OCF78784.1 hypothetical protein I204_00728 [Kwoniella mangroviensis CBS 8886]
MTRPSPTHFLCLPLINSLSRTQLDVSLGRLRDAAAALRVPGNAFRPIGTLHLTLGVMDHKEGSRLDEAIRLLNGPEIAQTIRDMISRESRLTCNLKSLSTMRSPSRTSVVYIHPEDPTSRLLSLCQRFQEIFISSGLIIPENRPLRLHATVINTRYVSKGDFPLKIDATSMVRQFKEEIWAENVALERLAICKMGADKMLDPTGAVIDEQYREVAYVNFA